MKFNRCRFWPGVILLALMALAPGSWAQRASNWRVYRLADGLPESGCVSVTLGSSARVLVRHLHRPLISELNGYGVTTHSAFDTSSTRVYGSPAGQLWTVAPHGLLAFHSGTWTHYPIPEIAAEFNTGLSRALDPVPLHPVRHGIVLFLVPQKLIQFSLEDPATPRTTVLRAAEQTGLGRFLSFAPARDGGLWISGARGLAKVPGPLRNLAAQTPWQEFLPPASLQITNLQVTQEQLDGAVVLLASGPAEHRVMATFSGQEWQAQDPVIERVRMAWSDDSLRPWVSTIDSLYTWSGASAAFVPNEEVSARQYFDVAVEPSGVFWLATSEGLFRHAPLAWRSPPPLRDFSSLAHSYVEDPTGRFWFISGNSLFSLENERLQSFPLNRRLQQTTALYPLKSGVLLLEDARALTPFDPVSGTFGTPVVAPDGARLKPIGRLREGSVVLQKSYPNNPGQPCSLEAYDGTRFTPLAAEWPEECPEVAAFYHAQNGDLWLAYNRGTAVYRDQKWRRFPSSDKSAPEGAVGFAELGDGKIWCAGRDSIWQFDGRFWSIVRGGFDRINTLCRTRDNSLWIASNSGLDRFYQGTWIENGVEEGLPNSNVRELWEDQRGRLWAVTTRGIVAFHPDADLDPPHTVITPMAEGQNSVPEGRIVSLMFSGQDKWKFTPRERLLYSFRLDDRDWSPFTQETSISFPDLSAGKHYFQVRAMDRHGNVDPKPAQLEFNIAVPWYREARLLLVTSLGVGAALFFAALAFNRHRQLLRSYAEIEKKIADRTQQLERANQELFQSQKMNALGTLAAGIAHDFNNILSIIKGSAQIIEDNLEHPDKVRTRVDRIKTVVDQGAGIVKAMLGFSRGSDQQPAECDLNAVVEDTLKLLGDRFLREVQVEFQPAPHLPPTCISKDLVQQILLNFIFNAAEAMARRKQIIITTQQATSAPPGAVLSPGKAERYLVVAVTDFGCGITPENLPRIWEPFFTTKAMSTRRGTGLGLSMVYELARKVEAGLGVRSIVGQGSTFSLVLPVRVAAPAARPGESHPAAAPASHAAPPPGSLNL